MIAKCDPCTPRVGGGPYPSIDTYDDNNGDSTHLIKSKKVTGDVLSLFQLGKAIESSDASEM